MVIFPQLFLSTPQLHTDLDKGDSGVKYTLSGEGAGTIFTIDQTTGDIHALRSLDREEKAYYTLRAQAVDIETGRPLEPESEFVIKVQDINDNEPKFLEGPYTGSVPEMSPVGKEMTSPSHIIVANEKGMKLLSGKLGRDIKR
ncbi:cadherin-12 [Arapaima gigas]